MKKSKNGNKKRAKNANQKKVKRRPGRRRKLKNTSKKSKKGGKGRRKERKPRKGRRKHKKSGKGRRKKGNPDRRRKIRTKVRTTSTCSNVSCLNNLLQVLKVDKDTVQNFMQQKKRMDTRLKLLSNKNNKSSKVNESLDHLAAALGGNQSLRNNTPVCGGRYNNSQAQEVGEGREGTEGGVTDTLINLNLSRDSRCGRTCPSAKGMLRQIAISPFPRQNNLQLIPAIK